MYAANPLDRGRLLYAPSLTVHDPNPPLTLDTPAGGGGSVTLAGTMAAGAALTGNVNVAIVVGGTITTSSTLTGQTSIARFLGGTVAGSSAITGALLATRLLGGSFAGLSTASSNLKLTYALGGQGDTLSALSGNLFVGYSGQIHAVGVLTGLPAVTYVISGTVPAESVVGDIFAPDPVLYPDVDLYPGASSAQLSVKLSLGGTIAAQSTLKGGYTELDGTIEAQSALGYWFGPSPDLYPSTSLYSGLVGGVLTVEHPVALDGGTVAATSGLTGALVTQTAQGDPVDITIFIGQEVTISISFGDPVDIESENEASVLIGVSDG